MISTSRVMIEVARVRAILEASGNTVPAGRCNGCGFWSVKAGHCLLCGQAVEILKAKPRPCVTERRRVFRDGTFRWDHKTYQAKTIRPTEKPKRYGVAVRDDGSVYLRRGYDWVDDAVELPENTGDAINYERNSRNQQ